jgi:ubiquinone/menaquinone biosynthesis C-methylase UbiE
MQFGQLARRIRAGDEVRLSIALRLEEHLSAKVHTVSKALARERFGMARDAFQLAHGAAATYEKQKVKAIFRPLAEATLAEIDFSEDDVALDVACGTGIVARVMRERASPKAAITGVDLNEGMIETARAVTSDAPDAFRWHVGDVTDMPFGDSSFTLAVCQQGLQFFPDGAAALSEIRRVLKPGGRIILTVWAEPSRFFIALAEAIGRHVSAQDATRSLAPFTYAGLAAVPALLRSCGFDEVRSSDLSIERIIRDPATSIPLEIAGNPVGPAVSARGEEVMASIVSEVMTACSDLRRGSDLISPQTTRLFAAVAV